MLNQGGGAAYYGANGNAGLAQAPQSPKTASPPMAAPQQQGNQPMQSPTATPGQYPWQQPTPGTAPPISGAPNAGAPPIGQPSDWGPGGWGNKSYSPGTDYGKWRQGLAGTPGYVMGNGSTPVPFDPSNQAQMDRNTAMYGTPATKGYDLPQVRVPGVTLNPNAFAFGGQNQAEWNTHAQQALAAGGPQGQWGGAQAAYGNMQQGLQSTQGAMDMYHQMAMGQGPNLGQTQLQGGLDQSIHAQQALANSQRGGPMAMASAQRQAAMGGDQMRTNAINQAAMMQQQAQLQGMQGYMQGASQYGGLANQMMGNQMQMSNADLQAAQNSRQQNYGLAGQMYGYGSHAADQQFAGQTNYATNQANLDFATQQSNANLEAQKAAAEMQLGSNIVGSVSSAVGSVLSGGLVGGK